MKRWRWVAILVILSGTWAAAKMHYADPQPTFDKPRRIIMRLTSSDRHAANHLIGAINNIFKEYPTDALQVAVLAYGPGMQVLRRDFDAYTLKRIRSLMAYDVTFIGCRNTMRTMGWTEKDFVDGIQYVQAGVAEAIERQAGGWIDATPY